MQITLNAPISSIGGTNAIYRVLTAHNWATGEVDLTLITPAGDPTGFPGQSIGGSVLTNIQAALKSAVETKLGVTAGSTTLSTANGVFLLTLQSPLSVDGKTIAAIRVAAGINLPASQALIRIDDAGTSGKSYEWVVSISGLISTLLTALAECVASALGITTAAFTVVNTA
jgi:hypothetical protein